MSGGGVLHECVELGCELLRWLVVLVHVGLRWWREAWQGLACCLGAELTARQAVLELVCAAGLPAAVAGHSSGLGGCCWIVGSCQQGVCHLLQLLRYGTRGT